MARGIGFTHKYATVKQLLEKFTEAAVKRCQDEISQGADEVVNECKATTAFSDTSPKKHAVHLRDSIHKEKRNNGLRYAILVDAKDKNGVAYGWYVEATHPFLFPTVNAHREDIKQRAIRALKGAADDVKR